MYVKIWYCPPTCGYLFDKPTSISDKLWGVTVVLNVVLLSVENWLYIAQQIHTPYLKCVAAKFIAMLLAVMKDTRLVILWEF